ncbi:MAG TPA: Txe/YoeB family addiction module toxin [Hanamia sp.]|jgi:toxin YoeB|nr:Txe/YoeB family addiction module toxin [Hanamia sp.]
MEVIYAPKAFKDIKYWKKSGNKVVQNKISELIEDIKKHPFEGIGQPELLQYKLSGLWSRRINHKDRIVYMVSIEKIEILSMRGHYLKIR